jgi:hypothetical protein
MHRIPCSDLYGHEARQDVHFCVHFQSRIRNSEFGMRNAESFALRGTCYGFRVK